MAQVWYVDKTGGADVNGGSSEGSPKASGAAGATLATNATITLTVDNPDLSAVVAGDTIRVATATGGLWDAVDIFIITSVDDMAKTVDVTPSPSNTVSGQAWAIGGAFATIQRSIDARRAGVGGEKTWVKGGSDYTEAVALDHAIGIDGDWGAYEGYTATTGDGGLATVNGGGVRANGFSITNGSRYFVLTNFRITNHTGTGFLAGGADFIRFIHCKFDANGASGATMGSNGSAHDCYFLNNVADGLFGSTEVSFYTCCVAIGNGGIGFRLKAGVCYKCLAKGNGSDNFCFASAITNGIDLILDCISDGDGKVSDIGVRVLATDSSRFGMLNTLVYDCVSGIEAPAGEDGNQAMSFNNLVNGNTTEYTNYKTVSGEVTSTPLFVDRTNNDYTPTPSSPAKNAGFDITAGGWITETGADMSIGAVLPVAGSTCDYPSEDDVRDGVDFNNGGSTGDLVLPTEAQVQDTIGFGSNGTEFTGTLGATCDYPIVGDVEKGVVFANGTKTGTFKVPAQAVVVNAEQYGAGDTEFTGSFMCTTGDEAPEPFLEL